MRDERYWLIWDGECGLCRRVVHWVERQDRKGVFRTSPYQETPSPPMTPELQRQAREAVLVIGPNGQVAAAARAAVAVLREIGWIHVSAVLGARWILPLSEFVYRIIARNRALVGRMLFGQSCARDHDASHDR